MRVEAVEVVEDQTGSLLAASVRDERVFWRVPAGLPFEPRGEPLIAALLPAAMRAGEAITLPDALPVDAAFLQHIASLQQIFARWYGYTVVPIRATVAPRATPTARRATGYSGGIDSSWTVADLGRALDAVMLIDGIEFRDPQQGLLSDITARLAQVATARHFEFVVVQTNVKAFGRALGGSWSASVGAAVASAAHVAGFAEYHIAASNSWENLRPYGSHPVTDPLWSSGDVRIHHHGTELRRIDKVARLAEHPDLLSTIRVCFQGGAYNCGECQKCLMTRAALRTLGLTSPALAALDDPRKLRRVYVEHDGDFVDWEELLTPTVTQTDAEFARELQRLLRRYRWRGVVRTLDDLLTGGRLRTIRRVVA